MRLVTLRPDYIFERFVSTEGTSAALDLAVAFASGLAGAPQLLLLHGPPGAGKSHLLQSTLHRARARQTSASVAYTTAAEFVQGIIAGETGSKWASAQMLAVDDLHVLGDRPVTQREVAARFKARVDGGARVICAAGCAPAEIPVLASLFRDLSNSRSVELRPAGVGMRRVVASLAASENLDLSPSVLASIAARSNGDVRRAVGAIARRVFDRAAVGF
jgi:chromosomal replication initiation ATPase DnaA